MRDTVTIKLSVVEAANLEDYLLNTMEKIDERARKRGHFNTTEKRFIELSTHIGAQTLVTDEEHEYASMINEADDNQYRNQN